MMPLPAEKAGLTEASVKDRLSKMGGTLFSVSDFSLSLDDGLFLPVGEQNALRRAATDALTEKLRQRKQKNKVHPAPLENREAMEKPLKTALFYRVAPFVKTNAKDRFDVTFLPLEAALHLHEHMPNGVALPPVIMDDEMDEVTSMLYKAKSRGARYALVSSLGAIALSRELGLIPIGDFRLNVTNKASAALYRSLGVLHTVLSPELSPQRAASIGGGEITYGRIPLMLTERCFVKDIYGCKACESAGLTDRRGIFFPTLPAYRHRRIIFNSLPTYLGDKPSLMPKGKLSSHMIFTTESGEEIQAVLTAFDEALPLKTEVRRAYK